jgi:peptide-methionine (R)-S-oxide reductase
MTRRGFVRVLSLAGLFGLAGRAGAQQGRPAAVEALQKNWKALLAPGADVVLTPEPLKRSNAEWKKLLTPAQYEVLREEGTERAGSSPLDREKRPGIFACAGCGLALFSSDMKFDSGTGWPSFFTTIPGAFGMKRDFKLILPRTEYHCMRCGGHQFVPLKA